jgi:ABC-2 type transport system ATP-binding protein
MAQRIGLAQAMVNDPDLVLLDEPTDGVDPGGRRDIRDVMGRMKERGKTVFVNSHLLTELEVVCDRVAILVQGRVARQGTIDELTVAKQRYEIEVAPESTPAFAAAVAYLFDGTAPQPGGVLRGKLPTGEFVELNGNLLRVGLMDPGPVQPIIDALRARGVAIRRVQAVRPSLEELFIETTEWRPQAPPGMPAAAPIPPPDRGAA